MRLSHWQSWLPRRYGLRLALGSWCWLAWCSVTHADSARILLVRAPDVSNELAQSAASDLATVGEIADPRGYLTAAQTQHIEPTSEAALTTLGPQVGARLLVALEVAHGKLHVSYRDGKTGALVTQQSLAVHGQHPKLPSSAAHKLSATARHVLSKLRRQSVAEPPHSAQPEPPEPDLAPEPAPPSPEPATAPTTPGAPEAAESVAPESVPSAAQGSDASEDLSVRASVGGGVGARTVRVPTRAGGDQLDIGFSFPAIEIGLDVQYMLGSHWLLGGELDYRAMFGLNVSHPLATGETVQTSVTSHSGVAGVAPGYRFGERGSADLRLLLGWTFRGLYTGDDAVPSGTIQGPVLRPELRIPLADGLFTLRLAPELIVVIQSSATLRVNVAGLQQVGIGFGGEASLDVRLTDAVQLGLEYRESHALVASGWGNDFIDLERYALARIGFRF
jgi:hypothetical protein